MGPSAARIVLIKRGRRARRQAGKARCPQIRDGFLSVAEQWETLALAAPDLIQPCASCAAVILCIANTDSNDCWLEEITHCP